MEDRVIQQGWRGNPRILARVKLDLPPTPNRIDVMGSRVVRSLVLACSLLVALPQGWCCLFAFHQAKATASTTTGECCPCCPTHSAPNDGQTPAKNPTVPGSFTCCCADRHATAPETSSVKPLDTGAALALPLDADSPRLGDQLAVVEWTDLPPPTPHLHLLNCVWLC
ncbi:MAG TPA: hypothetical protein PKC45_08220 [Gemmatales bacterium]|nr:hypothetical protein [Gemmatales bacterium]